jgi:hypothetical protein
MCVLHVARRRLIVSATARARAPSRNGCGLRTMSWLPTYPALDDHLLYLIGMPWNSRLRHPIHLADSRVLRTLADARDMIQSLPERDQRQDKWHTLANLLMSAARADNASLTAIATDRIEDALRLRPLSVVRLAVDIQKKPPAPSERKRSKAKARRARRVK